MTPQARIASVIEILQEFIKTKKPADDILNNYLKSRRYIGSKDRRFITDFFWKVIRNFFKLCWLADLEIAKMNDNDARKLVISALINLENQTNDDLCQIFDGSKYGSDKINSQELEFRNGTAMPDFIKAEIPLWLYKRLSILFNEAELKALLDEAKPILRINNLKINIADYMKLLDDKEIAYTRTKIAPYGIVLENRIKISDIPYYNEGYAEFQDEASQLVALLSNVTKGNKVLDFCAGAGGKTLAIADLMQNEGEIIASDISLSRLNNIHKRIQKAGINIIKPLHFEDYNELLDFYHNYFDVVLVDAPCSGTGTFRRSPDARIRLNEKTISKLNNTQKVILNNAAKMVKNGGRLVYVTCSVLPSENDDIINDFVQNNPDFNLINANHILLETTNKPFFDKDCPFLKLTPYVNNTDGFFASVLTKNL